MGKLDGKVAVITGAAVGLGAGIAEAFVKHGAKICMINRSERVEETAELLDLIVKGLSILLMFLTENR